MFDIGFWEMAFIGVIALVVIGPERLPGVARTAGLWVGKARRMVGDIKADVKKEMNEYDLQQVRDLKQEITSASDDLKDISGSKNDPLGLKEVGEQIKGATEEINESLDVEKAAGSSGGKKKAAKKSKKKATAKKSTAKKSTAKKSTAKKSSAKKPAGKKSSGKKTSGKKSGARKAADKKTGDKAGKNPKTRKNAEGKKKGKNESSTKTDSPTGGSTV